MNARFFIAVTVVLVALVVLIYAGVSETAKAVVQVDELLTESVARQGIRLGARVTEDEISYRTTPEFLLEFHVSDIVEDNQPVSGSIPVVYHGVMPDTLQAGRDVILEGNFNGGVFEAKTLLTQCPSKYEPPLPGSESEKSE